mgnify:CR=1 FL=1
MIELYTAPTPNGHKVSCTLEAMELEYTAILVNLSEGDQHKPNFLKISPNGRIPAIIDKSNNNLHMFESGAIMIYLAEKTGKLISDDPSKKAKTLEWLMFQMGGLGPMQGQANVFGRYFEEKIPSAISRYRNECRRLYSVLDKHLEDREWICDEYSIADIANWTWVRIYKWSEVDISGLDNLRLWMDRMKERPACQKGCNVPPRSDEKTQVKSAKSMIQK